MSPAAPPAWVLALPLDSGAWRCLVGLWSYADYGATGPAHVWPTREQLASRTGQSLTAVKKQLAKLVELGLASPADSRGWSLAWSPEGPGRSPQGPGRPLRGPAPTGTGEAPTGTGEAPTGTAHLTLHDLLDLGSDLAARDRHLAIVVEQQSLRAEVPGLTREVVEAVRAAGQAWAALAERPAWCHELAAAVAELELAPAQVGQVLAAWDRAADAAGGALVVDGDRGRTLGLPTRYALWWARWRPWVRTQLGLQAPGRSGISCAPVQAPRFGGRASW